MYTDIAKNPLRTFLGFTREKNKNIKASPKKRSSYKKRVYIRGDIATSRVRKKIGFCNGNRELLRIHLKASFLDCQKFA